MEKIKNWGKKQKKMGIIKMAENKQATRHNSQYCTQKIQKTKVFEKEGLCQSTAADTPIFLAKYIFEK